MPSVEEFLSADFKIDGFPMIRKILDAGYWMYIYKDSNGVLRVHISRLWKALRVPTAKKNVK